MRAVRAEGRGDLVAFFACLYFAALRPGEALRLRDVDCELPNEDGCWGQLTLTGASSRGESTGPTTAKCTTTAA